MLDTVNHTLYARLAPAVELTGAAPSGPVLLAEWAILLGPALLVGLWIAGKGADRRAAVAACLTAFLAVAIAAAISAAVWHPRPFMEGLSPNYLGHAPDSSFPSDHATLLFALGFSLLFSRPPQFRLAWIIPMCLAVAVGWARVYLGVHYPLDIAGAALVGLSAAAILVTPACRQAVDACTRFGEWLYALLVSCAGLRTDS